MTFPHLRAARLAAAAAAISGSLALAGCSLGSDNVSCSGTTCTATLHGDGASAEILGAKLTFAGTKDGRATLGIGGASVSCTQGQRISAGPLTVTCTRVTDSGLELTASLG